MITFRKITITIHSLITIMLMQTAQADDLFTVYQHAKESDPQIRATEASYLATLEKGPQALADFKPKVTLSGSTRYSAGRNWTEFNNNNSSSVSANYTLSLTKPLYRPQIQERIVQTNILIAQSEESLIAEQQNLILRVTEAYFGYLQARDGAALAREEAKAIDRQNKQIIAYFEAGRSAITDVQESKARNAEAKSNVVVADQNVEIALEKLYGLTGRDYKILRGASEQTPMVMPQPNDMNAWANETANNNQQVISAQFAVDIAQKSVDIARAGKKPTVDLFANHNGSVARAKAGADSQSIDAAIGVQFSMTLYDAGKADSAIREARYNFHKAIQQVEVQRRAAVQQTRSYFLNIKTGKNQIDALKRSLRASQTAAKATQEGFRAGTRTAVDVILSLRETYRAHRNYASARYDFLLNTIRLKQSAGTLHERDLQILSRILNKSRTTRQTSLPKKKK
ncbi:MAG: TolC family outer membrane protein [Leucothrix sp.]